MGVTQIDDFGCPVVGDLRNEHIGTSRLGITINRLSLMLICVSLSAGLNAMDQLQALSRAADSALDASVEAEDSAIRAEDHELGLVAKACECCHEAEAVSREAQEAAGMVRREVVEAAASPVRVEEALVVATTTPGYDDAGTAKVVARSKAQAQVAGVQLTMAREKAEAAHVAVVAATLAVEVALSMKHRASAASAYGE